MNQSQLPGLFLPFHRANHCSRWMDLDIILSEVSQIKKDKYHMIPLAFMWHLKKKSGTDELIYKSNSHRYRMLIF